MNMDAKAWFLLGGYVGVFLFFTVAVLIARSSVRGRHRRAPAHR